ncbi:MAG TPA: hypothetical protein VFR90_16195 [Methylibium sp.]|uniref:hypothetical protein n=1 Tax=Methylibium sp. TaxID=2067992 RepID=UPI002DBB5382|nr:hypothetical protein [Methylibium sp.]HEU4460661.1 hypothetical protein [Methylibium sp.]
MPMKHATLERWIWVLLYGGVLASMIGLWSMERDARLGWLLVGAGITVTALGVAGVAWRARLDRKPRAPAR